MGGVSQALVLGYGSIGRRHASALAAAGVPLAIVNRGAAVRRQAAMDHPRARVVEGLDALDRDGIPWSQTAAVIATWGPTHAALFHALADRGVRRILCEKPMATSVGEAADMAERAQSENIFLGLSHTLRYAKLAPALRELSVEYGLGEPVAVIVEGGAACLVTNGIHWIDFATELFDQDPVQVVSTGYAEAINPRSPELALFGGTAMWAFGDGREAVITFSNRSSLLPKARIYYRDAVVTAGYITDSRGTVLHGTLDRRPPGEPRRDEPGTRAGPADALLVENALSRVREFDDGLRCAAADLIGGQVPTCPPDAGVTSVSSCIGALVAARNGVVVGLPLDPHSERGRECWPVS